MMDAEPTCRYCQNRMLLIGYGEGSIYTYDCPRCMSRQAFLKPNAQPWSYSFQVGGQYQVQFFCTQNHYQVWALDKAGKTTGAVLRFHAPANKLTRENTTVERIRTLILFS